MLNMTLEQVIQQAKQLSAWEKMRLIQAIAPDIEKELIHNQIKQNVSSNFDVILNESLEVSESDFSDYLKNLEDYEERLVKGEIQG